MHIVSGSMSGLGTHGLMPPTPIGPYGSYAPSGTSTSIATRPCRVKGYPMKENYPGPEVAVRHRYPADAARSGSPSPAHATRCWLW